TSASSPPTSTTLPPTSPRSPPPATRPRCRKPSAKPARPARPVTTSTAWSEVQGVSSKTPACVATLRGGFAGFRKGSRLAPLLQGLRHGGSLARSGASREPLHHHAAGGGGGGGSMKLPVAT